MMSFYTVVNNSNSTSEESGIETSERNGNGEGSSSGAASSEQDQVILSVYWKNGKLGAVAYSIKQSEVHVLYDIIDVNPEFRLLNSLFLQVQPWKVVTCCSLSEIFLKTVKNLAAGEIVDNEHDTESSATSDVNPDTRMVHLLSGKKFNVDRARHLIFGLRLPGEPDGAAGGGGEEEERRNHIQSQFNLSSNTCFVAAFGGLLNFLGRSIGRLDSHHTSLNPIQAINENNLVWVDNDSLRALQVFSDIRHPSPYKWNEQQSNKEGVSLLSLFNRCSSSLGSKRMRALLSQPTQDLAIIKERQDVIEFFVDNANNQIAEQFSSYIVNISSVTDMLKLMTNGRQSMSQWKSFYKTLYYSILVGELCKEYAEHLQVFSKIAGYLCDPLYVLGHCIYSIIDFEASADQKRFCVHKGVSESLDKALLSQPTQDLAIIKERQDVIEFFVDNANNQIAEQFSSYIVNISSVTDMLKLMTNGRQSMSQWKSFYKTLYYSILVGELCKEYAEHLQVFSKIAGYLCDPLYVLGHCIYSIIDFEASADQKRFCVHKGVSESLDKLKEEYSRLPDYLSELLQLDMQDLPASMASYYMVYVPEVGYMVAVKEWNSAMSDQSIQNVPGLKFQFKANGIAHYKSASCFELDEKLGDMWVKIVEQESKIMLQVLHFIRKNVKPLLAMLEPISELDCLLAMAQVAKQNGYCRPELIDSDNQLIEIVDGRHPLQEMYVDSFISNDTLSSRETGLVKIIMGPNSSGKSVYLKQVALIAYMAHTGSFVPATKARIGILDQIHTRIQTTESVSTQLSAFLIDIRQMTLSIFNSTNRSLLVVDEFGRGTSELDGLAMAAAFVRHFLSRGPAHCPHLLVSTHSHSLPDLLLVPPAQQPQLLTLLTTDYLIENDELVYLYKIKEGTIKSSLAIKYVLADFSPALAERALQVYKKFNPMEAIECSNMNGDMRMILESAVDSLDDPSLANEEIIKSKKVAILKELKYIVSRLSEVVSSQSR
ncbi:hypothetical protein LSTR_LSTR007253 [Laodelphax striatellus]|uniref:DNA mismatch repair proteins mutS family domain-containing protein n=1 Tax=Laodelphax striatellus TaxID=195883 RepID=A0A482XE00_LAOST|nr:hypothetical protein LSTR_LSTR007253 [Laodelphax striatellus]